MEKSPRTSFVSGSKIKWTAHAAKDLESLWDYLALQSSLTAEDATGLIRTRIEDLKKFPEMGRVVPEFDTLGITQYRELIVSRYRIIYLNLEKIIFIYALIDQSQSLQQALINRLPLQ